MIDLQVHKDVLRPDFCMHIYQTVTSEFKSGQFIYKTNHAWGENIVKHSATVLIKRLDKSLAIGVCNELFNKGILDGGEYEVMSYIWMPGSYIPWHDDHVHEEALTLYLNPVWDDDWGGIFLYKTAVGIGGVIPEFNTAVRNKNNIFHTVTPVIHGAPPRCTIQIFKPKGNLK